MKGRRRQSLGGFPVPAALTILFVSLWAGSAHAGGKDGTVGVGAEFQISGLGGASVSFDQGDYHIGAFLGFSDGGGDDDTDLEIGGRFFYHVHSTPLSDFSIGGGLGIASSGDRRRDRDDDRSEIFLEPGIQIRAFVASNVGLSFTAGLALGLGDADGVLLTGQPPGSGGVHYYFV